MDRDSIIYYLRRRLQVFAYHIFTKEFLSKTYYFIMLRKKLHLKNPKTFNEKLQWYKLYYCPQNDLVVKCADKYTVREYLELKGHTHLAPKLYGVYNDADSIKRVDFFAFDDFYTFSELTFTPGAAMMPLKPYSFDIEWGKHFVLPQSTDNFSSGNFL